MSTHHLHISLSGASTPCLFHHLLNLDNFFLNFSLLLFTFFFLLNVLVSFFLPFSLHFLLSPQCAPGPSEFQRVPQTIHCLGNVVCCLPSPPPPLPPPPPPSPPPPPVWQEMGVRCCLAPGSSRPLGLKSQT